MSTGEPASNEQLDRARQQIRQIMTEVAALARQDVPPPEFFRRIVGHVVLAMSAAGGSAFTIGPRGRLDLQYQQQMPAELLDARGPHAAAHQRLLHRVLHEPAGMLVPPHSGGAASGGQENPTGSLLVLAGLSCERQPAGVLCVYQRAESPANARAGYLQFLRTVAENVELYLLLHKLREKAAAQSVLPLFEQFAQAAHSGLDLVDTCDAVANEGRRLLQCDRLSVAVRRRGRFVVEAVSGQEVLERRSTLLRRLQELVDRTAATGRPFSYAVGGPELPPELAPLVESYLHESSARRIEIVPLARLLPETTDELALDALERAASPVTSGQLIGALLIEQYDTAAEVSESTLDLVRRQASLALGNAIEHRQVPLRRLWKLLASVRRRIPERIPVRALLGLALAAMAAAILTLVQTTHTVPLKGRLETAERVAITAPEGGVIARWLAAPGLVAEGTPLVELRSADLDAQLESSERQLMALRAWKAASRTESDSPEIAAARRALDEQLAALERDAIRLRERHSRLTVVSPRSGSIEPMGTDGARREGRRVERGDELLTLSVPEAGWRVHCPVTEAALETLAAAPAPLTARIEILPSSQIVEGGTVTLPDIAAGAPDAPDGRTGSRIVTVGVPSSPSSEARPGWPAVAVVDCGRRALGYVWFDRARRFLYARLIENE